MALLCSSIVKKQMLQTIRKFPSLMGVAGCSSNSGIKIQYKPYQPPEVKPHDDKNMALGRPMSPHLLIYSIELSSFTSLSHRVTGMVLSGYFTALGIGALALPHDVSHYISIVEGLALSSPTLFAAKFTIALPFAYHFANGIRHLLWDTGRILTLKEVRTTGYLMMAASVIAAAILAAL